MPKHRVPPGWYYESAVILRKLKRPQDEVRILRTALPVGFRTLGPPELASTLSEDAPQDDAHTCIRRAEHRPSRLSNRSRSARSRCLAARNCRREVLLGRRPFSLPFRLCPLFLCGEAPTVRAVGGFGRPAASSFRSKTFCHEVGELGQGDLAIAQLRAPLGGGHGDHPSDQTSSQTRDQHQPLAIRERHGVGDIPREFDAAVRGVDVLTAWPGRTREAPAEFRRGNRERGRHLKIHATSVARHGRDQSPHPPRRLEATRLMTVPVRTLNSK